MLTNNGSGGFGSNATLTWATRLIRVTAADVNGDGKLDLICANYDGNTLTVLTNNGSGGFVLACHATAWAVDPISVTAADVNGDGKLDLICANDDDSTLTVLTNNGSGGFVLQCHAQRGQRPDVGRGGGCQRGWQAGFDLREL